MIDYGMRHPLLYITVERGNFSLQNWKFEKNGTSVEHSSLAGKKKNFLHLLSH